MLIGGAEVGQALVDHPGVALLSATGSTRMGRAVGPRVAERFGRSLLELGGNNAAVVSPSADLDLATRGVVFSAAGTAGPAVHHHAPGHRPQQRHRRADRPPGLGVRPAADRQPDGRGHAGRPADPPGAPTRRWSAPSTEAGVEGGKLVAGGGRALEDEAPDAYYARPAIVRIDEQTPVVARETFAPLLYVLPYDDFDEAIALNNAVPAGPVVQRLHLRPGRGRAVRLRGGLGLRDRQRQHRHVGRGDRRRVRR